MVIDAEFTIKVKTKVVYESTSVDELRFLSDDERERLKRRMEFLGESLAEGIYREALTQERAGCLAEYSTEIVYPVDYNGKVAK